MLFRLLVIGLLTLTCTSSAFAAQKRVALVIGNGDYVNAADLPNPANDAAALTVSLERLGFEVVKGLDLDLDGMREVVREFSGKLEGADVALFFYAGHGVQVFGENYLIPTDADLNSEADLDFSAVKVDLIQRQMERQPRIKLMILDACRDNPFEQQLARSMGKTRSTQALSRGLAAMSPAGGTLLAYATDPGDVALDGDGDHSPFTTALLRHIETPGLEVGVVMTRVRGDVFRETNERQRPWTNTSLTGEFYLHSTPEQAAELEPRTTDENLQAPPATGMTDQQMEVTVWQSAQSNGTAADYREYLRMYPEGRFAGFAKNRIEAVEQGATTALATAPAASTTAPTQVATAAPEPAAAPKPEPSRTARASGPEQAESALRLKRAERRTVQRRLSLLGYDPRGVDGLFGPGTRNAIGAWQAAQRYRVTQFLNASQYAALLEQSESSYQAWSSRRRANPVVAAERAPAYVPWEERQPEYREPRYRDREPRRTGEGRGDDEYGPYDGTGAAGAVNDILKQLGD